MTQIARPVADNAASTCDVAMAPPGGGANWSALDETTPNDATDYSEGALGDSQVGCLAVDLDTTSITDPERDDEHRVEVRCSWADDQDGFEDPTRAPDLKILLWQGSPGSGTKIAEKTFQFIVQAWGHYSISLTESQAASITDYADLSVELRFTAKTSSVQGDKCRVRCTWVEFSAPEVKGNLTTAQLEQELADFTQEREDKESAVAAEEAAHIADPFRGWCFRIYEFRRKYMLPLARALEQEMEFRLGLRPDPPDVPSNVRGHFDRVVYEIETQFPPTRDPANNNETTRIGVIIPHTVWKECLPRGACD